MAAFVIDSGLPARVAARAQTGRAIYGGLLLRRAATALRWRGGALPSARLRLAGGLIVAGASGPLRWSPMTPFSGHTLNIGHLRHPTASAIGQSVTAIGDSSMRRRGHR
jgi:hypothetical protein